MYGDIVPEMLAKLSEIIRYANLSIDETDNGDKTLSTYKTGLQEKFFQECDRI